MKAECQSLISEILIAHPNPPLFLAGNQFRTMHATVNGHRCHRRQRRKGQDERGVVAGLVRSSSVVQQSNVGRFRFLLPGGSKPKNQFRYERSDRQQLKMLQNCNSDSRWNATMELGARTEWVPEPFYIKARILCVMFM